jgi:LysM repeat protein
LLELCIAHFYRRRMKRILLLLAASTLFTTPVLRAQDAATEERLNKLAGRIEDLTASQEALGKRIEALGRDIESLRASMDKPTGNYAGQEDLKHLAEAVKEIDRKRLEDYEKIRAELLKLGKSLSATPAPPVKKTTAPGPGDNNVAEKPAVPDKGYDYIVNKGDTLSIIVQAYRDKNIKVSTDQILKANPGLKAEKLRVGQKIFIPAPQS